MSRAFSVVMGREPAASGWRAVRLVVGACGLLAAVCSYAGLIETATASFFTVVLAAFLCVLSRRNRALLYIHAILLYVCYSIYFANYVGSLTTLYVTYSDTAAAHLAMSALVLFLSVIILAFPPVRSFGYGDSIFPDRQGNQVLVCFLAVVLLLILVYGFGRPDALGEERGTPSAIYEYSTIIFIVAFYLAGSTRWLNGLLVSILLLFALQNIVYGGRVTALQLLTIMFFVLLNERMRWRELAIALFALFALFVTIGSIRTGIVDADFSSFVDALSDAFNRGLAWDTAYSSWHTSITFILFGEGLSSGERAYYFSRWLLSIFLGGSVEDSQLATVTSSYYLHYNGGVLPVFFQFYLGWFGVALFALYVAFMLRLPNGLGIGVRRDSTEGFSPVRTMVGLYIVVTVPRWILYTPSQITRGALLCLVFAAFFVWFDGQMIRRRFSLGRCRTLSQATGRPK